MNTRNFYYSLSPGIRRLSRRIFYLPVDLLKLLTGSRDPSIPPKGLIFTGSGDFKAQGQRFLKYFIEHGELKESEKVLDIGCGIGRMAIPMTSYLNNKGSYDGFDVVKSGIKWCQKNISTKYPNFNFLHVNLENDLYNLSNAERASAFRFPYPSNAFNFAIIISVFTPLAAGRHRKLPQRNR